MSDEVRLLSTRQAAAYLGLAPHTLRRARSTGVLCGVTGPSYLRIGTRKVLYERRGLDLWIEQFEPKVSTPHARICRNDK